jgi:hypothetical protein
MRHSKKGKREFKRGRHLRSSERGKYPGSMRVKFFVRTMVLLLTTASWASAQSRSFNTLTELAAYMGADREKILLEGAKSEGKVVLYTSLSGAPTRRSH